MADRLTGPSGQEENASTESTPKAESALQKHLRRLGIFGEAKKDTAESDDDEEETDKPKKKFRNFFKGLFKNVVAPPESHDTDTSRRPNLESLFFGWEEPDTTSTPENPAEINEVAGPAVEIAGTVEQPLAQAPDIVSAPITHEVTHEARELPTLESPEVTAEDVSEEADVDVPDIHPDATTQPVMERVMVPEFQPNPTAPERASDQPPEREVIIERRGPSIALPTLLVGAEYLGRKRADRKLDAKFTQKSEVLEKSVKQGDTAREQLNTLVQQNKEQLEKLKRERLPILEKQSELKPEKLQVEKTEPKYERAVQTEVPKPEVRVERVEQAAPVVEERSAIHREQHKILEEVADAAERNVPVEKAFERSHEVKDDISTPTSAASIGAIMAAQAEEQKRVARAQTLQRQMGDTSSGLPVINDPQTPDMYQQAIKRGFWSAVIIIILGIMAYLVK